MITVSQFASLVTVSYSSLYSNVYCIPRCLFQTRSSLFLTPIANDWRPQRNRLYFNHTKPLSGNWTTFHQTTKYSWATDMLAQGRKITTPPDGQAKCSDLSSFIKFHMFTKMHVYGKVTLNEGHCVHLPKQAGSGNLRCYLVLRASEYDTCNRDQPV